jgi:transposase
LSTATSFLGAITHVATLVALVEDPQSSLPGSVRIILKLLVDTFTALDGQIAALDAEINQRSKADPTARRLMTIPGVGPITATAITALAPAVQGFTAGRDFAAWLGLTPLQKSTGGKAKTWCRLETRRTDDPAPADHWCKCRCSTGQPARRTQGIVACADAGS